MQEIRILIIKVLPLFILCHMRSVLDNQIKWV